MPDQIKKYYEILDLKPGASLDDIKKSCNELLGVWHPDKHQDDESLKRRAEKKTKVINIIEQLMLWRDGRADEGAGLENQ